MIFVALSANLPSRYGEPSETFRQVIRDFESNGVDVIAASSLWLTAPVPYTDDQPWYHNGVLQVETDLSASDLLVFLKLMEKDYGREITVRNAARPLDLDILIYNDELIDIDNLQVPHPRMHDRAFVIYPLAELTFDWVHPVLNKNIAELKATIPEDQGIKIVGPIDDTKGKGVKTQTQVSS